jgi:hypothetical protein
VLHLGRRTVVLGIAHISSWEGVIINIARFLSCKSASIERIAELVRDGKIDRSPTCGMNLTNAA